MLSNFPSICDENIVRQFQVKMNKTVLKFKDLKHCPQLKHSTGV